MVPWEHIVEDVEEIAATNAAPRRVMLVGGNPLGVSNSKLVPVLQLIREKLPSVKQVSGHVRTADLKLKSDEDLRELRELGVVEAQIGAECGWDEALAVMDKGHTVADMLEQYPRLEWAGIEYTLFYLAGFAGAGKCEQSARESAQVFSQLHPSSILVHTMTPFEGSRLRDDVENGRFVLAPESEIMRDMRTFIDNLHCETVIMGSHDTNLFRLEGILPRDREGMVATLDMRIAQTNDKALSGLRMRMVSL